MLVLLVLVLLVLVLLVLLFALLLALILVYRPDHLLTRDELMWRSGELYVLLLLVLLLLLAVVVVVVMLLLLELALLLLLLLAVLLLLRLTASVFRYGWMAEGKLKINIDKSFPLSQVSTLTSLLWRSLPQCHVSLAQRSSD